MFQKCPKIDYSSIFIAKKKGVVPEMFRENSKMSKNAPGLVAAQFLLQQKKTFCVAPALFQKSSKNVPGMF